MPDPLVNPTNQSQVYSTYSYPQVAPPPKEPGKFSRVFGGILGGAANVVMPGLGSVIGGFSGWNRGLSGFGDAQQMLQQSAYMQMQMLAIQNQVNNQSQQFTTVTNLLKSRHDGEMSAVQNLKS
jgi:hypothetical protein